MTEYNVYSNTKVGDPIDYDAPIATLSGTTFETAGLAPGTWTFGVRAFDSNGEEQNLDCAVTIVIDANGNDLTNVPMAPTGLRAFATAGGGIRVEWWYPATTGPRTPTGFYVYVCPATVVSLLNSGFNVSVPNVVSFNSSIIDSSIGATIPNYAMPSSTVLYSTGLFNSFQANLTGLSNGTQYVIGVRSYNASGEEQNTTTVTATAVATGPSAVSSLTAIAIV